MLMPISNKNLRAIGVYSFLRSQVPCMGDLGRIACVPLWAIHHFGYVPEIANVVITKTFTWAGEWNKKYVLKHAVCYGVEQWAMDGYTQLLSLGHQPSPRQLPQTFSYWHKCLSCNCHPRGMSPQVFSYWHKCFSSKLFTRNKNSSIGDSRAS